MKSFNTLHASIQRRTGDENSDKLTQIKEDINQTNQLVLGSYAFKFLEATTDITTTASNGRYELGNDVRKIISVITSPDGGTTIYTPEPVEDPTFWEYLQSLNRGDSDITQYYYQEGNDLLVWPDYATASDTITVRYRRKQGELSRDDYTTGTITSITNGAKALVGDSTSWLGRKPVGEQWIRIDYTDGDYAWYRVATIGGDTSITLEKPYQGTTIAAATETYTLGEFSIIPGQFHDLLLARPLALYYDSMEQTTLSARYWRMYDGGFEAGLSSDLGGLLKKLIEEDSGMLDTGYYPPAHQRSPRSAEFDALNNINSAGSW